MSQTNQLYEELMKSTVQKLVEDSLANILQPQLSYRQSLDDLVDSLLQPYRQSLDDLEKSVDSLLQPFLESLNEQTKNALIVLSNHGWFFDLEMPIPFMQKLAEALENDNFDEAESALVEYFRERLPIIKQRLDTNFPHRMKIIGAALNAHERGEYELSVPVFLIQADGICYEVTKYHFFLRKNKKPCTAAYVELISRSLTAYEAVLLYLLENVTPLSKNEKEREANFNELNRPQVLHGEVLDYGTEINSLKALSLLNYITQVLCSDHNKKET